MARPVEETQLGHDPDCVFLRTLMEKPQRAKSRWKFEIVLPPSQSLSGCDTVEQG